MAGNIVRVLSGLAMIAVAPGALAQAIAPAPQNATKFSDADIAVYAALVVRLNRIQAQSGITQAERDAQVAAAVKQSKLDPKTFDAITTASDSDPQVEQKIQQDVAEITGPHMTGP